MNKIVSVFELPFSRRQRRAMEQRKGASLGDFLANFPGAETEATELWKELRSVAVVDGFCPAPEDDLLKMYGLADEDLDEVVVNSLSRLCYPIPTPDETKELKPVKTVRDAVIFLKKWRGDHV